MASSGSSEQPIYTAKAHVFHIDPQTKRSWIPASSSAVNVNFFYDSPRNLYRIISVEGTKAVINSTITPNMTFTKTSQKFGQWSDVRANTVYGLGFATEPELNKFIDKFQEIKEATRSAAAQHKSSERSHHQTNGSVPSSSNHSGPPSHQHRSHTLRINSHGEPVVNPKDFANDPLLYSNNSESTALAHKRSQSLSGLQASKVGESPRHLNRIGSSVIFPSSSAEAQLRYENDRLKLALAQSSANAKKWEIELLTLKNNNTRLTNALQESTANVEEWKRQLQALKDENSKMRMKLLEQEAVAGNPEAIAEIRKEITHLRVRSEALESDVKQKDKEIEILKQRLEDQSTIYSTSHKFEDKLKALLHENETLRKQLARLNESCEGRTPDAMRKLMLNEINVRLAQNVQELRLIQQELNNLLNTS